MHELSIARNVVAIVTEHAKGAKVTRVTLEIGALSAVLPDAVRFCFDVVAQGTVLEGAELDIVEIPARGRCHACGAEVTLATAVGHCQCGSGTIERLSGDELMIRQMVTV